MRNTILFGTAAILLAFGGANAFAMGGGGNLSPEQSPYALLAPQTLQQPYGSTEGRAAYEGPNSGYGYGYGAPVAPVQTPEDSNRYSRGR